MSINIEQTSNIELHSNDSSLSELAKKAEELNEQERNSSLGKFENTNDSDIAFTGINLGTYVYGLHRLKESSQVKEIINDCKSSISETIFNIEDKISNFFGGIYNDVKYFFIGNDTDAKAIEKLGDNFVEQRDFGLDKCTESAKEIFNPGVIENWSDLSTEQRKEISGVYAAEVANAFELQNYTGVYFEDLEQGVMGYNNGDGNIHLSNELIKAWTSPLEIMNTITHELRHQYQFEAVQGYHNVADDVRNEWATAQEIYNYDQPYCYDPWGYTYNPLEIDARYAGETVVRNVTHDMFNA